MLPNLQETANLGTCTEEIFNGKLRFLCSDGLMIIPLEKMLKCEIFCEIQSPEIQSQISS